MSTLHITYHFPLVIISVVIAVISSYIASDFARRSADEKGVYRHLMWLTCGSLAMGIGIWSMHFTGMLASNAITPVHYDLRLTLFSLLVAVLTSWIGLRVMSRQHVGHMKFFASAGAMGLGMGSMHYLGMAAVEISAVLKYNQILTTLALLIAIGGSYVSLKLGTNIHRGSTNKAHLLPMVSSAIVLGATVSIMHYTAMAGTSITLISLRPPTASAQSIDYSVLALYVGIITEIIFALLFLRSFIDRRNAVRAEKIADTRHKSLFAANPDAVFLFDQNGTILEVNSSVERILGYPVQEMIGQSCSRLLNKEDESRALQYFSDTLSAKPRTTQISAVHKTGRRVVMDVTLIPCQHNGEMIGIYVICKDITGRIRMESQLRSTKEELESLFHHTTDAILLVDLEMNVLKVNSAFEQLYGWKGEELIGFPVPVFPDHLANETRVLYDKAEAAEEITGYETVGQRRDGSLVDVSVTISPIWDVDGNIMALAAIYRDITDRKRSEELLIETEKLAAVSQLAAGIAHEIRNPLTPVKGFIQLLQSKTDGFEGYFRIVLDELKRVEMIISEFLVLAKQQHIDFQLRDVRVVLQEIVALLQSQAVLNNIYISTEFADDIPSVHCDVNRIKQVFVNLLKNAIEVMPDGGTITVEVSSLETGNGVLIRIIDQGNGMSAEQLAKLGEPFYTTKEKGTGLGVMISRKIIHEHQGHMQLQSEIGKGTVVEIILPAQDLKESQE